MNRSIPKDEKLLENLEGARIDGNEYWLLGMSQVYAAPKSRSEDLQMVEAPERAHAHRPRPNFLQRREAERLCHDGPGAKGEVREEGGGALH